MLKDIAPRVYQQTIFAGCIEKNCLVVLPTGMGKTLIALLLAVHRLKNYPKSKILILSPTRPLVEQHLNTFKQYLEINETEMALFTGFVSPEKRKVLWSEARIIFSTPQGLENDILSQRLSLDDVSLVVFDECHKAVGDYAYVFIAKQYQKSAKFPRILALTASPGSDVEKIIEMCRNLFIEGIEVRSQTDDDVKEYIKEIDVEWLKVELPDEFKQIKCLLESCCRVKTDEIKKLGIIRAPLLTKTEIIRLQAQLHAEISRGEREFSLLRSVSILAEILKTQHALELLETQGIFALYHYFVKLEEESLSTKVKALKNLMNDIHFRTAIVKTKRLFAAGIEHPKISKLKELVLGEVAKNPHAKVIVFNQFRDSALKIVEELNNSGQEGIKAELFVGQAKKAGIGLTQKRQGELLNEFKLGLFNVLVATSVAEEGLDIPKVDLVVFYEPVPSAIRHIQRRGRTGRQERGRVIVLVAKETRDEAYRWAAHRKEQMMLKLLKELKHKLSFTNNIKQSSLVTIPEQKTNVVILVDYREKGSNVMKELIARGVNLRLEKLESADFILSGRVCVEYKTTEDFINSIIDGRLLEQAKSIKMNFPKPLIMVEGGDFCSGRRIHPNAVNGMLAALIVNFGIPVIHTKDAMETASLLCTIAKKEQEKFGIDFTPHSKKPLTVKEQQEFIVAALPGIGRTLCRPLLNHFKSVKNIVNAGEEDLQKIEMIGEKKAADIKKVLEEFYDETIR